MPENWDNWVTIIRACCLTSKKPLTVYEISRDVKQLECVDIPYKAFNYKSLEEMIKNIPSVKVSNIGGTMVVQAISTEETAHIARMVQRQKPSKKKSRTMAPKAANRYNMDNRRPANPKSGYNRSNSFQNNVPNRPSGQYSSQQTSYNNRSQQQSNNEQDRRSTILTTARQEKSPKTPKNVSFAPTPPLTPKSATSTSIVSTTPPTQQRAQTKTEVTQSHRQRVSQPTQQQKLNSTQTPLARPQQTNFTSTSTTTTQQSSMQQRFTSSVTMQSQSLNIQERLNVQKSRPTANPPKMNDPRLILNSYVEARNLPLPIYKDIPSKDKNIYSSVTVNSKKYSSYPNEAKTKDDAEKLAAQAALAELLDKSNLHQTVTTDRALIMQRILDIVNSHPNGLFELSLLEKYIEKYDEGLPSNWLKLVQHTIHIDIGANKLTILSPQQNNGSQQIRTNSLSASEPPVLNISNLDEFWFKVYVVYSPKDVRGVIISEENSDRINDLAIEMKHFYDINQAFPSAIIPGQHYAVLDSEWHRVRCTDVNEDTKTATVTFIDRGDEDVFSLSNLRDLSEKFFKLPAQAIQISLDGLECLDSFAEVQELLEEALLEKDVWVTVDSTNRQVDSPLTSYCYIRKDDISILNVNEDLINKFMLEVADPKIFMKANVAVRDVYVSEIRNKQIYIQVKSTGLKLLNDILVDLEKTCLNVKPIKPAARLDKSKLYLVKNEDKWRRIKINKVFTDKAEVECVDEGSIIEVDKDTLVAVEEISPTLALIPHQATQVDLYKISPIMFDEKMAAHLRSIAPKDDQFIMKVVGFRESVPVVELYKRTEDNYLASLNDTIALEPEISSKIDDNNNDKTKSRLRNDRKSANSRTEFSLKTPDIPPIGQYFDVAITMAAHPGNFTVQPLQTSNELKKLMMDLAEACTAYNGPPLTSSNVKVGSMYAAKYDNDRRWYRAYVSKILGKNICAVYFCDYGDYRALPLDQLQPLANQFYDLPYQAIKAKLHGIRPILKGDWTVKDSLRFNELVVDNTFVSLVKAYDVDNTAAGETVLSLELIDTKTDDDVYIAQMLIDEKRAERIEN